MLLLIRTIYKKKIIQSKYIIVQKFQRWKVTLFENALKKTCWRTWLWLRCTSDKGDFSIDILSPENK